MRAGYTRTEAGVVPQDWEVQPLSALAGTSSGTTPARALQSRYYASGTIAWVKTLDLRNTELKSTSERVTETALSETSLRIYPVGTVLVAMYGGFQQIGRTGLLRIPAAVNQAITAIQPRGDAIVPEYLLSTLNYRVGYWKIVASSSRKDPNISSQDVRDFPIAFPKPPEQRAIAKALSDVDELLGAMDRLIAKKRDLKQAAMQQLLTGQTRLPGFQGQWAKKTFGDVITRCFSGATPRRNRPDYFKGDIRWITSGELNYNVITDTIEKITSEAVARTNLSIVPKGIFLMAITGLEAAGTRGSCGIVGAPSTTNQSCMAIFPTSELESEFLFHYYVFRGDSLALQYCQGTKQQSYTAKLVKLLPIDLPPTTAEQSAIAKVLSDMDAELAALKQRRDKTHALKQGMMQELLTGRTRLI
jgi:type I restriction enzyme S subunit